MATKSKWEFRSLHWIHRVREDHYRKTKGFPLTTWLTPVDPEKAADVCRRMGLRVRIDKSRGRKVS